MAKGKFVLNANVKFDGSILPRGTEITADHAGYDFLKKYLIDADAFVATNKDNVAVRLITKKSPTTADEKIPEAQVVEQTPAPTAPSDPATDLTKKEIIEQLTAKGVEFDDRAKKDDLLALLEANGGAAEPAPTAPSDPE